MLHHLSDRLFWDVNPALLDWEKDMPLIITRVVERGTLEEWRVIEQQYGLQKIVAAAKEIKSLNYTRLISLPRYQGHLSLNSDVTLPDSCTGNIGFTETNCS